jgi:hypothetical protein
MSSDLTAHLDRPFALVGDLDTGWYTGPDNERRYVVLGESVDRDTFLAYCAENNLDPAVLDERPT